MVRGDQLTPPLTPPPFISRLSRSVLTGQVCDVLGQTRSSSFLSSLLFSSPFHTLPSSSTRSLPFPPFFPSAHDSHKRTASQCTTSPHTHTRGFSNRPARGPLFHLPSAQAAALFHLPSPRGGSSCSASTSRNPLSTACFPRRRSALRADASGTAHFLSRRSLHTEWRRSGLPGP